MSISLSDFNALVDRSFQLTQEIDHLEATTMKPLKKALADADRQILQALTDHGLKNFKSSEGLVSLVRKSSVTTPKTPEEKQAFDAWLQAKGEDWKWSYTSYNSASINALYKQEFEKAKEEGDFDFAIPGIGEPTFSEHISRRKTK